jgi:2-iminobutanoate/2-iminopropanoate deaminase
MGSTFGVVILAVLTLVPRLAAAQSGEAKPAEKKAAIRSVSTDKAPKAIGPYSQAVVEGGFLFASGQIALDAGTGELVKDGIEASTERVLDNVEAILKAEGLSLYDVVKATVFMTHSEEFAAMNGIYAKRFGEHRPARSTVFVAGLPRGAAIEIEVVARARR